MTVIQPIFVKIHAMAQTTGEDIALRFQQAIRATTDRTAKEEYMHMTMEQLGHQQITFGKEKKGQHYSEVVRNDPRYVAWFISTYQNSDKPAHQKFIRYVKLYTEDLERRNQSTAGKNTATPGTASKSKAAPRPSADPDPQEKTPLSSPATTPRSEAWELLREETVHQNDRITQIEGALTQIVTQLQYLTGQMNCEAAPQ